MEATPGKFIILRDDRGMRLQDALVAILVNLNISTAQALTARNSGHHIVVETHALGSTQGNCISGDQKMEGVLFRAFFVRIVRGDL